MSWLKGLVTRVRTIFGKRRAEQDLDDEIRLHLELETTRNIELGMAPDEARRRALLQFGGVEVVKEHHRDGRGGRWAEELIGDIRLAGRVLRRSPGLTLAAVLTLGLGIAANTAVFSVVNAVILRPLPFADPERLVMLSEENPEKGWHRNWVAPANYLDWRERVQRFADVASYTGTGRATLTVDDFPTIAGITSVTGNFFSVLGTRPALGRLLEDRETWQSAAPSIVISDRLWRNQFGSSPNAVGRTVVIDGVTATIVGVTPKGFAFPSERVDIWGPMNWDPASRPQIWFRRAHWLRTIARLEPDVEYRAADAEFQTVVRQLQVEFPETNRVMGAEMTPLKDFLISEVERPLMVLQVAVVLLLLIACANVGNLLLVQAAGREREVALRLTLGAGQLRLLRQTVTESLLLGLLGAVLGIALGVAGTRALAALQPSGMLPVANVEIDRWVLGFGVALALASGLLFGLAPVLWNRRRVPAEIIKEGGRTGSIGRRGRRLGELLATAEVGLALLLAVGAGLLVRSYARLERVDPGFDPTNVLAVQLSLPGSSYSGDEKELDFYNRLIDRVQALPGVTNAGVALASPLTGVQWTSDFHVFGRGPDEVGREVAHESATPEFFGTLGIRIVAGRGFTKEDRLGGDPVVIINEALARKYFDGENPIGQRMTFSARVDSSSVWRTIVGVMANVHQASLAIEPQIAVFTPFAQDPNTDATFFLRTEHDPTALTAAVRQVVRELDPKLALQSVATMETIRAASIARQRYLMTLLLTFAGTGLVLAIIGVYGVMAQLARRRVREMGIRIALGAQSRQVQWVVVRQGLGLLAVGTALGTITALATGRLLEGLLFDIRPNDPVTFAGVVLVLTVATLAATWLPALRASRADPADVLRTE